MKISTTLSYIFFPWAEISRLRAELGKKELEYQRLLDVVAQQDHTYGKRFVRWATNQYVPRRDYN